MKKIVLTLILSLVFLLPIQGQAACPEVTNVKVNGLVCDFCARALEKVIGERDDVKDLNVDLDRGLVSVHMKPGESIGDAELKELVTDSGYDVAGIERGCQ